MLLITNFNFMMHLQYSTQISTLAHSNGLSPGRGFSVVTAVCAFEMKNVCVFCVHKQG
jgi:hypothetical protein